MAGVGPVGDLIVRALRQFPDRTAFVAGDRTLRYREVAQMLRQLVAWFDAQGFRAGDVVLQCARNSPAQWCVIAACYLLGLRSVTLHPGLTAADAQAGMIAHCAPRLVLCDASFAERVAPFRQHCPQVALWRTHDTGDGSTLACIWTEAQAYTPAPLLNRAAPEDIVRIGFTSGTTGPRKGVLLAARALAAMTLVQLTDIAWPAAPRVLCAEPLAGGFGHMVLPTLMRGGTVLLLDAFEPDRLIAAVQRHRPTVWLTMPASLLRLMDHPAAAGVDWSCLSLLLYSGGTLGTARVRQALAVFGPVLWQIHGQTECPKSLAVLGPDDHTHAERLLSLGRPCSGMQTTLFHPDMRPCAPGETGELCVRGPAVASGYFQLPDTTSAAQRGGWWHTGDLCRFDGDGYLHFVGRLDHPRSSAPADLHPQTSPA